MIQDDGACSLGWRNRWHRVEADRAVSKSGRRSHFGDNGGSSTADAPVPALHRSIPQPPIPRATRHKAALGDPLLLDRHYPDSAMGRRLERADRHPSSRPEGRAERPVDESRRPNQWHGVERGDQIVVRCKSILRSLGHHALDDRRELDGNVGSKVADVGCGGFGVPRQLIDDVTTRKGRDSGQKVVESAAERVEITPELYRATIPRLLAPCSPPSRPSSSSQRACL